MTRQNSRCSFLRRRIVKHKNGLPGRIRKFGTIGVFLLAGSVYGWTQAASAPAPPTDAMTDAVRQLQDEVRELRNAVVELRSEAGQYRAETEQLRKELESPRSGSGSSGRRTLPAASPLPCAASHVGRACRVAGRIFRTADQQIGRPIPGQSGGCIKVSPPALGYCAAESVQQSRIASTVRTFPPGRFPEFRMCPDTPSAPACGSRKLASKYLGRILPEPRLPATCNSILPEDLRTVRMESISGWSDCVSPACGWIGKIPRS